MQAETQTKTSQNIEKLIQTNKTKIYLLLKLLKLLTLRKNWISLNLLISKICSQPNLVFEIGLVLHLRDLKIIHWHLKLQNDKHYKK